MVFMKEFALSSLLCVAYMPILAAEAARIAFTIGYINPDPILFYGVALGTSAIFCCIGIENPFIAAYGSFSLAVDFPSVIYAAIKDVDSRIKLINQLWHIPAALVGLALGLATTCICLGSIGGIYNSLRTCKFGASVQPLNQLAIATPQIPDSRPLNNRVEITVLESRVQPHAANALG